MTRPLAPDSPLSPTPREVEKDTIGISLVHEALRQAMVRGVDRHEMLEQAGIDAALLGSDRSRVSAPVYARLWTALADRMDDEYFGMDRHPLRRGGFRLMTHACVGSEHLGQALQRMVRFLRLALDEIELRVVDDDSRVWIEVHERPQTPCGDTPPHSGASPQTGRRAFSDATLFILIHGLSCWLVGRRLPVLALHFHAPEPDPSSSEAADYRTRFCENVLFGQPMTRLALGAECMDLRCVQAPAAIAEFMRAAPANLVVRYRNEDSLVARVRRRLRAVPPSEWPDLEGLARALHLSPTTVQRHLKSEGHSYQGLKDALRCDLAIELLESGRHSVAQVGEALGFMETSAFYRAFKKWTGVNPGAYRFRA